MNARKTLTPAQQEYVALRAQTTRHTTKRFDELAWNIAHELSDGEDITPEHWTQAARILHAGSDCA